MTRGAATARRTVCGVHELDAHGERGVTHVLSILDPGTPRPAAFARYVGHELTELRFHDAIEPGPDVVLPQRDNLEAILDFAARAAAHHGARRDSHVLIHCFAGVSRSTAAMTALVAQAHPEESADAVFARVLQIRPRAWPNLRMIGFADDLLGRGGALVDALGDLYARQLVREPALAEERRRQNRWREVEHARRGAGRG